MKRIAFLAILMTMFAAGCASPSSHPISPGPESTTMSSSSEPSSRAPILPLPPVEASRPAAIEWTSCNGAEGFTYGPNGPTGPKVPPGWEKPWPINGLYYTMFECERMSVGPFERGPVHGVIEQFSAADQPEPCLEGDFSQPAMLANWWIDDPDIAAYLAGLGMPAHYAKITVEKTDAATQALHIWRWVQDGDESWMTFEFNGLNSAGMDWVERIFWFTDSMVGIMDLDMVETFDIGTTGIGELSPPSIYAASGSTTPYVASKSGIYTELGLSASLRYFGDFQCEQPLP